ncbi:MAG: hypothetical protein K1X83_11605 [Oligoflexia bacterium]|nr:hypothetical protein [Oligoflexia bacterium]
MFPVVAPPAQVVDSAEYRTATTPSLDDTLREQGFTLNQTRDEIRRSVALKMLQLPVILDYIDRSDCHQCVGLQIRTFSLMCSLDDSLTTMLDNTDIAVVPFSNGDSISNFVQGLGALPKQEGELCLLEETEPGRFFTLAICNPSGRRSYFICVYKDAVADKQECLIGLDQQFERIRLWEAGLKFDSPESAKEVVLHRSSLSLAAIVAEARAWDEPDPVLERYLKLIDVSPPASKPR